MTTCDECSHEFKNLPPSSESTGGLDTEEGSTSDIEEAGVHKNTFNPIVNDERESTAVESKTPWYCSVKFAVGLLLLGFVAFVIVDTATNGYVKDTVSAFLDWIEENPISGFFSFVVVYMFATVLFIPGSILTLGAGFVFSMSFGLGAGVVLGTISVFIGASFGAIIAFVLGRYLLREQVSKLSKKYAFFEALNLALEANGLKIFLLLRLSPIIPFAVLNYVAGALSVSFRDYVLALVAILPGTILYVFLGASAGSLTDSMTSGQDSTVTIIVVVVGVVFGVLAICLTTRYARKELNRLLEERQASESDAGEGAVSSLESTEQPSNSATAPRSSDDDLEGEIVNEC